jgi:hypothetical protein
VSGAVGIETSQLTPRDNDPAEARAAAITCANHILDTGGSEHDLLELLRELGLAHDPMALDRTHDSHPQHVHPRGTQQ